MFALILGDALRRIVKSLKMSAILEINYKMLIVHVFLLASLALVEAVAAYFVFIAFKYPTDTNKLR